MTQFPKLLCALCATLFCAGAVAVHAEDNAAQAAARAQLSQELQIPPALQTNNTSAPHVTPAPALSAPAAPSPMQAVPAQAASSASGGDNPAQAAARALLYQQMAIIPANANAPATTPAVSVSPATDTVASTPDVDAARQAKVAAEGEAAREVTSTSPAAAATPTPVAPIPYIAVTVGKQFTVPAPPISADQAARLQALDAKYTADQISPADYFTQRETILKGQ